MAAAMFVGGVIGATVASANAPLAVSTPTPPFKSNEATTHEAEETVAQEAVENSGTRPSRPPRPPA